MLIQRDVRKLFQELVHSKIAQIEMGGSNVTIHFFGDESKYSLKTTVYYGGNFIPKSVRNSLKHKAPIHHIQLKTFLSVDEKAFKIHLNCIGTLENVNPGNFLELLEEFCWTADEWRLILDEQDRNDLIHVRVPQ